MLHTQEVSNQRNMKPAMLELNESISSDEEVPWTSTNNILNLDLNTKSETSSEGYIDEDKDILISCSSLE